MNFSNNMRKILILKFKFSLNKLKWPQNTCKMYYTMPEHRIKYKYFAKQLLKKENHLKYNKFLPYHHT